MGWKLATPIQCEALPYAFEGRDLIGLAETGSGKTAAFGIPMLQRLLKEPQKLFGLVLAPTRELAFQIGEQLEAIGSHIDVRCMVVTGGACSPVRWRALPPPSSAIVSGICLALNYGADMDVIGVDMISQQIALAKGPHIVVGTPGRVVDHLTVHYAPITTRSSFSYGR